MKIPLIQYWDLLYKYLQPQRGRVWTMAALLLGSIGMQLVNPQIMRSFIDAALAGSPAQALRLMAVAFIGIALAQQVVAIIATYFSEDVSWTATNHLRADLAMYCLRLDMTFHNVRTPGELIERIDHDVTALANFFSQFVIRVVGNLVLLLGILVALYLEDWRVGAAFTVYAFFALATLNFLRSYAVPHWRTAHQRSAELYGFLEERLAGTEDIRSSGATDFVLRGFDYFMWRRARQWRHAMWMFFMVLFSLNIFGALGIVLAVVSGVLLFTSGLVTIGTVYLIVHYTVVLFRPLEQITEQIRDFQRASASIVRINELYAIPNKIVEVQGQGVPFPTGPLALEFKDVSFNYKQDETVLHNVNFKLEPGRVLGLLGRTGSGKSTMARLLFRLYDPISGSIEVGGQNIRQARLTDLRNSIGIVTQEVQLFHATIRDNLTFFDNSVSDEHLLAVMEQLDLTSWLEGLPDGLDTMLEFAGGGLSAGEAQLVAFTRVFLSDPGVVILDEASSRIDPATEQLIQRAIDRLLASRTGIIIAHRLSSVHRADEIMILEDGHIREHGPYQRLVNDPQSRFYALLQTGLEEVLL